MSILFIFRNKAYGKPGTSMMGLGVNCLNSLAVLKRLGIVANASAVWDASDVEAEIVKYNPRSVIIEAPWIEIPDLLHICTTHPKVHFYVRCHSNLAFLQVEPGAINLIRETILYSESLLNLNMASNSFSFCQFVEEVYHGRCVYLPNLYNYERIATKRVVVPTHVLKVGSFGAIRLQKNHISGAGAALILARRLGINLEFNLIVDGTGGGKEEVVQSIRNLFSGLSWAKLVVTPWSSWPVFRRLVSSMDLAFHLSCTETFSLSTADCLAENVPVVGSEVIYWLPKTWQANLDNPEDAARVGYNLLHDVRSPAIGQSALENICVKNEVVWVKMFK